MPRRKSTPGISRIDQPAKRTHGFFVRLWRKGRLHTAFFTDLRYGGKRKAFAAAQEHYRMLLAKHGAISRVDRARRMRRRGASGIQGVRFVLITRNGRRNDYWQAMWSTVPYVVRKKQFSVRLYGRRLAKLLARVAREEGVLNMAD